MTPAPSNPLNQARELFIAGNRHHESGELHEAQRCYEAALALAPGRASVLANLGLTLFKLQAFARAAPILREAMAANTDHPGVPPALGLSLEALGEWQESLNTMTSIAARQPDQAEVWMSIARCHNRLDNIPASLQAWDRALSIDPELPQAWSERGNLLRHIGKLKQAAQSFQRALALGADRELHEFYLAAVSPEHQAQSAPPPPAQYAQTLFDQYAGEFDKHLVDELHYSAHTSLISPLLKPPLLRGGHRYRLALDLGCGTGLCAELLAAHCDQIDGVDVSSEMVHRAQASAWYRRVKHGELVSFLKASHELADLIVSADVFIYVGALEAVFDAAARRLSPGGIFAFSVEHSPTDRSVELLPSLRYGHSRPYILGLAQANALECIHEFEAPIRQDQRRPVMGRYVYLRSPHSA
jgi:predicted TPR repeat methyltransferase